MKHVSGEKKAKLLKTKLLTGVALAAISIVAAPQSAQAVPGCTTGGVSNGTGLDHTVSDAKTSPCYLFEGDTLLVEDGASIVVENYDAVYTQDFDVSIVNLGTIQATGCSGSAIYNIGTIDSLVNTGVIETTVSSPYTAAIYNASGGVISLLNNDGGTINSLSNADAIMNIGELNLTNNGGSIWAANGSAIYSGYDSITNIDNTNGTIHSDGEHGIYVENSATVTINNTDGFISSDAGAGIQLNANLADGYLENSGGMISTNNSTYGALEFYNDIEGDLTVHGGTILNTSSSNSAAAVNFEDSQSGRITFDGVTIIADGDTEGSGNGYAIFSYEYDVDLVLTDTTYVRGNIALDCCASMVLDTSATIEGNITTASYNDSITINGGSITGNIDLGGGEDTLTLNDGIINGDVSLGSDGDILTLNGGEINGSINFGSGDNDMRVGGAFATAGIITGSGDINLTINDGGTLRTDYNDGIPLDDGYIEVHQGGTLYLTNGDIATTGSLYNDGTVQIGLGRSLYVETINGGEGAGQYVFDVEGNEGMHSGILVVDGDYADLSNNTVGVNYVGGILAEGDRSRIFSGGEGAVLPTDTTVSDNSYLYDFGLTIDEEDSGDIYLEVTNAKTLEEAADSTNNLNASRVLVDELNGNSDPIIQQIQSNLTTSSTQEEYNEVLESTQPTIDNGNQTAAVGMTGAMFDLADGQLSDVGTSGGSSSGDQLKGLHFWMQGFGGTAEQDRRKGIDGYEADIGGLAFGVDTRNLRSDTTVGLSLGYANSDVDSKNANRTNTDIDSYQLMAYGNHDFGGNSFMTAMAVYGINSNDQVRHNVGGIAGLNAYADYDSWTAGFRGAVGHNYHLNKGSSSAFKLTPQFFSEYVHFKRDGYTETGAGGANLIVGDAAQNIWNVGTSLQAEWEFKSSNGTSYKPDVHVSYKYDLAKDAADTSASFAAGGTTFATNSAEPASSTFGIGAGLKIFAVNNWDFTVNYDYNVKSDYDAHSGFIRAAYQF